MHFLENYNLLTTNFLLAAVYSTVSNHCQMMIVGISENQFAVPFVFAPGAWVAQLKILLYFVELGDDVHYYHKIKNYGHKSYH